MKTYGQRRVEKINGFEYMDTQCMDNTTNTSFRLLLIEITAIVFYEITKKIRLDSRVWYQIRNQKKSRLFGGVPVIYVFKLQTKKNHSLWLKLFNYISTI